MISGSSVPAPTQSPVSAIVPAIMTRPASPVAITTLINVAVVPVPAATPLPTLALVLAKTLDPTSKCTPAFPTTRQYATFKRRKTIDPNQQKKTKAKTTRFLQEQISEITTPAALSIIPATISVGVPEPVIRKSTRIHKRKSFADELALTLDSSRRITTKQQCGAQNGKKENNYGFNVMVNVTNGFTKSKSIQNLSAEIADEPPSRRQFWDL
ncbi:hypothetical protein OUZ56_028921 [Daphnia magna]|uniref:Uncharacterized protein n=1 Tax=Daphnia magna TaxID=35525 RepID=A0ABR0B5C8_9CRUS|nr:hypothetical protein OUZ56_028921 [Daphnia magna]